MNTKKFFIFSLLFLAMAGLVVQVNAGNTDRVGTAGAQELLIPVGARGTALGGSMVACVGGVDAVYWNPAGIASSKQSVEAMFSHMTYIADIGLTNLAVATKLGFGSLAFSFQSINFGDIAQTSEDSPEGTGITFSPTYFTLGASFSRAMTDRIYIGVTAKMVSEKIMGMSASGAALDMGVQYVTGIGLKFGVAMKNYGTGLKFGGSDTERLVDLPDTEPQTPERRLNVPTQQAEFPSTFELGVSYEVRPMDMLKATVMANFINQNFGNDEIAGGVELVYNDMFFLRGGYTYGSNAVKYLYKSDFIFGPTLGAGLKYNLTGNTNLAIDYAYRMTEFFDDGNIFTLKLEF